LARRGYRSAIDDSSGIHTFVVLDAARTPGGAWSHRWESLHMATVNGIFDLPNYPKPPIDGDEPSRLAVPRYFADFERFANLPILRPVAVTAVSRVDSEPHGELRMDTDAGPWLTSFVINATGTWDNPIRPDYPGAETFLGPQLHTRDYVSADEFAGERVAVVGGGISAVQQLEEISRTAKTFWYTRREPIFLDSGFLPETVGHDAVAAVIADVEAGRPTESVVSYTGLGWTPYALAAKARGALERRPMFSRIEPHGVREADGTFTTVDTILWATGFKPALSHLDPLKLRNDMDGIAMKGTQATADPRVHLIGYGPSQSTVGANRAGRSAVAAISRSN
jgi:cation diffusion facilitator CzcD-associated flavoprotein CzcO